MLRSAVRLAVVALVLASAGARADDAPARKIEYAGDRLSVQLTKVPLGDVLSEVGRQAGAEIRGGLTSPRDVSAEFDAVALPEALHRLLGDQNFALVYGTNGSLRAVKLLGGPQALPPNAGSFVAAPSTTLPVTTGDPATLLKLVAAHPPVPISGKLASAIGSDTATVQQILETSLHSEDAAVRSEGVRRALSLIEAEPDLRGSLLGAVKGLDDNAIAGVVRSASPDHAEEIVVHIATQSRVSELRVKASSVLQQLRAQKGTPQAG